MRLNDIHNALRLILLSLGMLSLWYILIVMSDSYFGTEVPGFILGIVFILIVIKYKEKD